MTKRIKQSFLAAASAILIYGLGVAGYMIIEQWNFQDAVYMVAITLSTVGFGETNPVSTNGRWFTIILIFAGGGYFLYLAGVVMRFVVEGEIRAILGRRRLDKQIAKMKNHYIVCGYGRIGRTLCEQLKEQTLNIVAMEKDPDLITKLEKDKMLYLIGDAADESLLLKAGIRHATHLISALATDTDNVFLVLTARQLNRKIHIMARSGSKSAKKKLLAAGANRVESPYDIGAVTMGLRLLRPSVSNFLDIALSRRERGIQIEESPVSAKSELVNIMLKDSGIRQSYNIIIISLKKADGTMIFNPSFDTYFEEGDIVISMGRNKNLKLFHKALSPP